MLIENNAGEAIEPEEDGEPEAEESEPEVVKSTDPLDAIEDEAARNLAKAERAKAQREARRVKEIKEEAPVESTPFATKDDLKKLATNEAKKLVAPEVKAAWDELVAIPLGGFDPMDAESIAKNMQQRFVLHSQTLSSDDPAKAFTSSPNIPISGGGSSSPKPVEIKLPGYRESTPPEKWY